MHSLYLTRLFNVNNQIKCVQFLANDIEILYADNSRKKFCYQKLGSNEDLDFAKKISYGIDDILEVSQDPREDERVYQVKYEELYEESSDEYGEGNSDEHEEKNDDRYEANEEESDRYDNGNGDDKSKRYNEDDGYNKGNENRYKDNYAQTSIKKQRMSISNHLFIYFIYLFILLSIFLYFRSFKIYF
jgi:hypothetical protein